MQVFFKCSDPQAGVLRAWAKRRLRFVLRRLLQFVPRADVRLTDVNGPRGGVDKRCQLELRTDRSGTVVVSAVANDWRAALDEALARAARHQRRMWHRGESARRPRAPLDLQMHARRLPAAGATAA
jgi:ribosome-associated translation inhibitor RaiA